MCWASVKPVHSDNRVNDSAAARREAELCLPVVWSLKGPLYFSFTSLSQWIITPMCAVIYELRYQCWEQFLSGGWHPPTDCHYLSMCMWGFLCVNMTKCELCCCKGLLKPMRACLFQSVWGEVIVFLSACVRPAPPPSSFRVTLLVTGYSNVLLCWVLIVFKTERCELWNQKSLSASLKCHHTHFAELLMGLK